MIKSILNHAKDRGECKKGPAANADSFQHFSFIYKIGLSLLLLVLMGNVALASHFKGGYFTYTYLGEGQYEFLMTGYWEKDEVGSMTLRYQGYPAIDDSPVTVSQTLLEDGETVEHVQRQRVTWSKPGVYQVFWRNCCRAVGSNFNHNLVGLYGAVNYNPEAISSSPKFYDERNFNFNSRQRIKYTLQAEDPEGHEQEFSLETPFGLSADVYKEMLETGFKISPAGILEWENPLEGVWLVKMRLREKIDGAYTGAFIDREIIIYVDAPGKKPAKGAKQEVSANSRSNAMTEDLSLFPSASPGITVYPHPVTDASQVVVALEEADWIRVEICDLSGRLVKLVYTGRIEADQPLSFEINNSLPGNKNLYIGRLITTKEVFSFKLILQ